MLISKIQVLQYTELLKCLQGGLAVACTVAWSAQAACRLQASVPHCRAEPIAAVVADMSLPNAAGKLPAEMQDSVFQGLEALRQQQQQQQQQTQRAEGSGEGFREAARGEEMMGEGAQRFGHRGFSGGHAQQSASPSAATIVSH